MTSGPVVTVVIPMLNESVAIGECLEGFAAQTYAADLLDIVVVDGGSTDGSRQFVEDFARLHPWVRVVENPRRRASAAFNRGIEAAKGDVVCLFSAHGVPSTTYVEHSVDALAQSGAAGVGGQYLHVGTTPASSAIGLAMVSPFGMGSLHRFATRQTAVDTISHPAYRKRAVDGVGPFDESLLRNSDYEFNYRLRQRGEVLLFDPSIVSTYRPRPGLRALARQFWWYGRWKARVARRHPGSVKPRHLVAPGLVVGLCIAPLALGSRRGRRAVLAAATAYVAGVVAATATARPTEHDADAVVLAASFPVMHVSWGAGFLASVVEDVARR